MHEKRIEKLVNDLFYDVVDSEEVREQKEELRIHLAERVEDYVKRGLPFDEALAAARASLGDPEELVSGFERKKAVVLEEVDDDYGIRINFRLSRLFARLTPLAPFLYVIIGVTQGIWREWFWVSDNMLNWWAWGWVIIPVIPILSTVSGFKSLLGKLPALSPFIYLTAGFLQSVWRAWAWVPDTLPNWWAWGWLIIPLSGILFSGMGKKKRKKKKNVFYRVEIEPHFVDDIHEMARDMSQMGSDIAATVHDVVDTFEDEDERKN